MLYNTRIFNAESNPLLEKAKRKPKKLTLADDKHPYLVVKQFNEPTNLTSSIVPSYHHHHHLISHLKTYLNIHKYSTKKSN